MLLGKIVGSAVATRKYEGLQGAKLLVVQPLDKHLHARGASAGGRGYRTPERGAG
ncbi:MAG: EutN/CcmL family microcompartment protein [Anaerolineae bacterium]|uniref:EutN/CcmL family microcompartment protein n=1 Tax=Candidatus Amarolinea dominans TaxID=3140696 RepID=UPI0031349D95|nr:EutN/CcmL family microcompartment protein [Anaerolineae bacterium]